MKIFTYELYSDLYETTPVPLTEIERLLGTFSLEAAMLRLMQINILLAQSRLEGIFDELQVILQLNFFDDVIIHRLKDKYEGKIAHPPYVFIRPLVLFLMRVCARVCSSSENARKIDSTEEKHEFGRCFLWITDYFMTEGDAKAISKGSDEDRRKAMGPQLAVLMELASPQELKRVITRADTIFSKVVYDPKVVRQSGGFDFSGIFKDITGLTIQQYCEIIFFIVAWFYGHNVKDMLDDSSKFIIQKESYISPTKIDPETFDKFLELTSFPFTDLSSHLSNHRGAHNRDFSAIQSNPLMVFDNGAIACLDLDFLIEKLSTGVYRFIFDHYPEKYRGDALTSWGYIFEQYVHGILGRLHPPVKSRLITGAFAENLKYQTKEEAFDGILISPTNPQHLLVFQYKSRFIKPEVKYSDDVDRFERALDHEGMFGLGRKGGVTQLATNIEFLWHRDKDNKRKKLMAPLDNLVGFEKVTPILVVQESFFRMDFFNWTLNNRFQSYIAAAQISSAITIEPLLVIDIESFEILKPYILSGRFTLSQVVNSINAINPDRRMSLRRYLSEYLEQFPPVQDEEIETQFSEIIERTKQLLNE
jgi:hypothetical protein